MNDKMMSVALNTITSMLMKDESVSEEVKETVKELLAAKKGTLAFRRITAEAAMFIVEGANPIEVKFLSIELANGETRMALYF